MNTLKRFVLFTVLATVLSCPCTQAHAEADAKECIISGRITSSEGKPISGVYLKGIPGRIQTDTNGNYQVTVPSGFSTMVTPFKRGYVFEPASRSYDPVREDLLQNDYNGSMLTFTISGKITSSDGKSISSVVLGGFPERVMTDTNGHYQVRVPYGFAGGILPIREGYRFAPAGIPYNQVTKDHWQCDYRGARIMYTISGNVGLPGVVLKGLPGGIRSDVSGNYTATVAYGWSGTVTPVKEGYLFEPASLSYDSVREDLPQHNYQGKVLRFTISGNVRIPGVALKGFPQNVESDRGGIYMATVPYGWSGTVMPAKEGYAFHPPLRKYSPVKQNLKAEIHECALIMLSIKDRLITSDGLPIVGVMVEADSGGGTAVSDVRGIFCVEVPYGWSGKLRFSCDEYPIQPSAYHKVVANIDETGSGHPRVPREKSRQTNVMIIPTGEVSPDEFVGISKDLKVMLHILKQAIKKESSDPARNVFADLGELLERNRSLFEAMYIQDYGVLFFLTADFEPSPMPNTGDPRMATPKKPADSVWQQAQETLFQQNRSGSRTINQDSGRSSEELVQKLIGSLKHAANINSLSSEEVVIVTVLSKGAGYTLETTNPTVSYGNWGMSGPRDVTSFSLGSRANVSFTSPTTITLCVQKKAIDDFATDRMTLEEFRELVKVSMY